MDLEYEKYVGQGASARVWRARDNLDRTLAVKFILGNEPTAAEQIAIEHAKALHRVNHPNVVRVHAVEAQPYPDDNTQRQAIIMDFIEGEALNVRREPLSLELARKCIQDIASALEAIHQVGLVHGDLHSGNVIIAANGCTLIDILYTHSLDAVGSLTAARSKQDDIRSLAVVCMDITKNAGLDDVRFADAYQNAFSTGTSPSSVASSFLHALANDVSTGPRAARSTATHDAENQRPQTPGQWFGNRFVLHERFRLLTTVVTAEDNDRPIPFRVRGLPPGCSVDLIAEVEKGFDDRNVRVRFLLRPTDPVWWDEYERRNMLARLPEDETLYISTRKPSPSNPSTIKVFLLSWYREP